MKPKKIIALITMTLFMVSILPAVALAVQSGQSRGRMNMTLEFKDSDSAGWAMKQISELKAKNIISGYKDGTFQPSKPVTRTEAVVMVLRATGSTVENSVYGTVYDSVYKPVYLPFKDAKNIPQWAQGYLTMAVQKGYLPDDRFANFQPNKPATRLWVTKLLVRALELAIEVDAQGDVQLPFNDAAAIPAGETAFVTVALENGLLQGYPDGTFKPNKPVTRAEMSVLLGKSDDEIPLPEVRAQKIEGTVVSVEKEADQVNETVYNSAYIPPASGTITILRADGSEAIFPVASDVRVYIEDQASTLDNVTSGLKVELVLNKQGTVVYIESAAECYRGRISVIDAVYGLTLQTGEGEKTFALAENVQVIINGKDAAVTDLSAGMKAGIKLADGKVAAVNAVAFKQKIKEKAREKVKEHTDEEIKEKGKNKTR